MCQYGANRRNPWAAIEWAHHRPPCTQNRGISDRRLNTSCGVVERHDHHCGGDLFLFILCNKFLHYLFVHIVRYWNCLRWKCRISWTIYQSYDHVSGKRSLFYFYKTIVSSSVIQKFYFTWTQSLLDIFFPFVSAYRYLKSEIKSLPKLHCYRLPV